MTEIRYHRLRVVEVIAETADSRSLIFELTPTQRERFAYRPGQFVTVRIPGDQGPVARCYSLASSPHTDRHLQVTVKRVDHGYASNWICDNVRAGAELDVLEPAGRFTPSSLEQDLLAFAGGSGITPIMSITKSLLSCGSARITLFYANRDDRSVIFGPALDRLAAQHPERLRVEHWLETDHGLPTAVVLRDLAERSGDREYFVCGPQPFMAAVRAALRDVGVPPSAVHIERFASLGGDPFAQARPAGGGCTEGAPTRLEVELDGQWRAFDWPPGARLLDLLRDNGIDAPASCGEGVCAACECRVTEGRVQMIDNQVLDDDDLAQGYVLACQSVPVTPLVRISYG